MNYEQDIDVMKRQIRSLRRELRRLDEWLDTVNSPLYKRIWWLLKGYNFYRLGRWYNKNKPWER